MIVSKLSGYGMKPSVVQLDFNDNNTRVDDSGHKITMIDLGAIVIAHPLVVLLNFLEQMGKHQGVAKQDVVYPQLQRIPFVAYADFFPMLMIFMMLWLLQGLSICCVVPFIRFDLHRYVGKTISNCAGNGSLVFY